MNFLILLGIVTRLLPHPANMTALGASSFMAGSFSDKRLRWFIPLAIMLMTDLIMGLYRTDWPMFSMATPWIYLSAVLYSKLGWMSIQKDHPTSPVKSFARCMGFLTLGSTQFYLITNAAVWLFGTDYSKGLDGLLASLIAGIPFYRNTVVADAAYFSLAVAAGALVKGFSDARNSV